MSLTKSQFDLLRPLAEGETDSAPATAEAAELTARGLLCAGRLTDAGLAALEPYRVRRMVVLAAGFGSRLRPVTLRTPKPLVRVNPCCYTLSLPLPVLAWHFFSVGIHRNNL